MSTDRSESKPLPGLPKAIFILQLVTSLMEEIKKLIALHRESPDLEEQDVQNQSNPSE